jgi:ABC-type antimicrobial peptide transport system permease subunit
VIPSIIFGYILSIPTLAYIYKQLFSSASGINITPIPTGPATLQALLLGLFIPIISSIIPIQTAMSKNINESMDSSRSKTKG